MKHILVLIGFLLLVNLSTAQNDNESLPFFEYTYDDSKGTVLLTVEKLDKEFLYMVSLAGGVGSNDLGLDRGKINSTRVVKFTKEGSKLLLVQPNLKYRAISDNVKERTAVKEAFASSVLWGFDITNNTGNTYTIDITKFLLQDANGIAQLLKKRKEGSYKLDASRSAIKSEQLHSFPLNTEFESILTFTGQSTGKYLPTVTPSSDALTIVQHQSFIALPDDSYVPRIFHPYSGFNNIIYYDYAAPIESTMEKRFITRHRLEKKVPGSAPSEAKEPIIYYVDSGCPEPIKSALIEGASWWNQAYTAAGFINAFQVRELPAHAHPLDVRYNVIQWVHRSTRGWSYGASVVDPRTGEILKGHVSLGSLRVRQDFMIAQGILSPYTDSPDAAPMKQMALARLRQLSAHEVGHTIGLAHNFAASTNDRASVMDYPHPVIQVKNKKVDLSAAYDDKIGKWDKRTITYGYTDIGEEDPKKLNQILHETKKMGLLYMSDQDARPMGSAHPKAHLWDNGSDPIGELERVMQVRAYALDKFGTDNIDENLPYSELEKVLVPVYLMHRYQAEAVTKLIGGVDYTYGVKGFDEVQNSPVKMDIQEKALEALLHTLSPQALSIPQQVIDAIPPAAKSYSRSRESFGSDMNLVFDPIYGAEAYANYAFSFLLHPDRLSRVNLQSTNGLSTYFNRIAEVIMKRKSNGTYHTQLNFATKKTFVVHLIKLAKNKKINMQVAAMAMLQLENILKYLTNSNFKSNEDLAHAIYLKTLINQLNDPEMKDIPTLSEMPPGSPIGCNR